MTAGWHNSAIDSSQTGGPVIGPGRVFRYARDNPLGRRVLAWILIGSTILAICSTAVQLWADYLADRSQLNQRFEEIERGYVDSVAVAVWNLDHAQMRAQLKGIQALPDIVRVELVDAKGQRLEESGVVAEGGLDMRRYALVRHKTTADGSAPVSLGSLVVSASLDGLYRRLLNRAMVIFATQGTKTLLVSLIILMIVRHLVSKPLSALARAARHIDLAHLDEVIELKRPKRKYRDDFDDLVAAMNGMRSSLQTELREANEARAAQQESDQRLRSLVESTGVVPWESRLTDDTLSYVGPQIFKLLGHERDDCRAAGFLRRMVHAEDLPRLHQASRPNRTGSFELECRLLQIDGGIRWVVVQASCARRVDGDWLWQGYLIDIDARKRSELALAQHRAELETRVAQRTAELAVKVSELQGEKAAQARLIGQLEDAQNQLLQSEKMAAIGQLAAGVAHEINNPIGFVNSNLGSLRRYVDGLLGLLEQYEKLAREPANPELLAAIAKARGELDMDFLRADLEELLTESKDGLERVKRIVQDLRDFSRIGETAWAEADLHACINSTLNVVANELKYKADIVKQFDRLPAVECLASQLNQVFLNLFVNAAHAIRERGSITIETGVDATSEMVWVKVRDTGEGIAPEHLKRIFEPFFTTKPVGKGTGLGLAVSYSIVQKHRGRIEVQSTVGQGTCFTIHLPVRQSGVAAIAEA